MLGWEVESDSTVQKKNKKLLGTSYPTCKRGIIAEIRQIPSTSLSDGGIV
jgi:hypothetical protein